MNDLHISIGCTVKIARSGDVIPDIVEVTHILENAEPIVYLGKCPTCNTPLHNNKIDLYCPNHKCKSRIKARLRKWIDIHNIMYIGEATLNSLLDNGEVHSISGLYALTLSWILKSTNIGTTMGNKILQEINKATTTTIPNFIAGFNIDGIGRTIISTILKDTGIKTIDAFFYITKETILQIHGCGHSIANALIEGLEEHRKEMRETLKYIKISDSEDIRKDGVLHEQSFVFTGALKNGVTREDAIKIVLHNGGNVSTSITKNTNYLVCDDSESRSSKMKRAQKFGVKIITYNELLKITDTSIRSF
jgi:DNA ligase (NAD+)